MSQSDLPDDIRGALQSKRRWLTAVGVVLVIVGVLAVLAPLLSSAVVVAWFGAFFIVAGVAQIVQAFQAKGWQKGLGHTLIGVVYALGGLLMVFNPLAGMVALSLFVVAMLLVSGILRIVAGVRMRPEKGWGWLTFAGATAVLAAVLIFATFPGSALWLLGLIAGVSFMIEGWALIALSSALKDER